MNQTLTRQETREPHDSGVVTTRKLPRRFDVHELPAFEEWLQQVLRGSSVLVLDASAVDYVDRSAMDALVAARLRTMDRGGDLALAAPSTAARIILELSGRYEALNPIERADIPDDPAFRHFAEPAATVIDLTRGATDQLEAA